MKSSISKALAPLIAMFVVVLRLQNAGAATPLRLDPVNPHYFLFRGQTVPLIGASPEYVGVYDLNTDYAKDLSEVAAGGLTKVRVFTGDVVTVDCRFDHVCPNRFVVPWKRSTTPGYAGDTSQFKFDLDVWDSTFFNRLTDLVTKAGERGIVVEVTLFSQHYNDQVWGYSPLKSTNNVNGVTTISWQDFHTLADPKLVARQDAYVQKVVTTLNQYDNVYYEVANEPYRSNAAGVAWHDHVMQTIINTESSLPNQHLIALDGVEMYSALGVKPSVINTHYVNDLAGGTIHWIAAFPLLDDYYTLNRPLGFDETTVTTQGETIDQARIEAWAFIVGGGAVYDNLNYQHPDSALYTYLRNLKSFMLGFHLQTLNRDQSVILSGLSNGALYRASSESGKQYAIYIHHSTPGAGSYNVASSTYQENPRLSLPAGTYSVAWVRPKDGKTLSASTITSNGTVILPSPSYQTDIALKIVLSNPASRSSPSPQFLSIARHPATTLRSYPTVSLAWQSETNKTYQVQTSSELVHWFTYGAPVGGNAGVISLLDEADVEADKFYRLQIR